MHNNMWVFFIPIMIIMKIEYTIAGKTGSLEFALFIKLYLVNEDRQDIYSYDFFPLLLGVQSAAEVGPTSYETPCIYVGWASSGKNSGLFPVPDDCRCSKLCIIK